MQWGSVITATPLRSSSLRGVATLGRCNAATPLPSSGWGLLASSRLRDAATLPRRCRAARVFASSRCRDAVTLRRCDAATLRRCDAAGGVARVFEVSRRCDAATLRGAARIFASSHLRNEILEPALRAQWGFSNKVPNIN